MRDQTTIEQHIHAIIQAPGIDENSFDALALRTFDQQYQRNTSYRRYCDMLGTTPENVTNWKNIPAVTTDVFKLTDHPLVSFSRELTEKTFLTSGTTMEVKGQHHFPSLDLYEASIVGAWNELALPRPANAIFLTPTAADAPHSSLSHMMQVLSDNYSDNSAWVFNPAGKIDLDLLLAAIQADNPIALLGTALAFLNLFDQIDTPLALPEGSWAMETGGYKGTGRQLEKPDFYALFGQKSGLPPESIINEYSMTELSSQFYTRGLDQPHCGPSWTRVRVIDPLTQTDARAGEPGHLVIYDLANLHSVMAIQTQDIAIRSEADLAAGNNSFTLLGRDSSALPRGCSRAADHLLNP